ncbi:MAG: phosphoglucosamine mutase [Candidatus Nanopelagicales bacterium]
MARLFGTDGVRGLANGELTAELALDLAVAAAHVLGDAGDFAGHRPRAIVGRDPRISGQFLEAAVVAGLASAGVDVVRVGVAPTPAIAFLTAETGADLGVVLSASHNAMPDNGIKFFARGGSKLDDSIEDAIEARMNEPWPRPTGGDVGRITDGSELVELYLDHLVGSLPNRLDGIRVVVDCANGAAFHVAPEAYRRAGAEVIAIHADPDGLNINDNCGSTHLEDLQLHVMQHKADLGIGHDGDADRCLAVDAEGRIVDGDQIMAILALALRDRGALRASTVVATVMSNLGFKIAMRQAGINLIETAVGDRYVLEAMRASAYTLGGEQSGHVIMLDHASTGDGTLTALHVMARMAQTKRTLSDLAAVMTQLPQVLINVKNVDKARVGTNQSLNAAITRAAERLGESGRVLLRPSGTEPLVRVMVEAPTAAIAQEVADELVAVVRAELSL